MHNSSLFVGLTLSELTAQAVLFFVAGSDTTATTLTFLCYNLALHPEIQERLTEEIHNVIGTKVCKLCDKWSKNELVQNFHNYVTDLSQHFSLLGR